MIYDTVASKLFATSYFSTQYQAPAKNCRPRLGPGRSKFLAPPLRVDQSNFRSTGLESHDLRRLKQTGNLKKKDIRIRKYFDGKNPKRKVVLKSKFRRLLNLNFEKKVSGFCRKEILYF